MKRYFVLSMLWLVCMMVPLYSQSSYWKRLLSAPTFDVAVNPYNENTLIVGGEGRWVYRSFDRGQTWDSSLIFYSMPSAMLNNVLILPTDTNVVLVGGLKFGNVVRSTDQGKTWNIALAKPSGYNIDLNGKAMLYKHDDPNVIYVGDFQWAYIYRSTDAGQTWDTISRVERIYKYEGKDTLMPTKICSIGLREDSTNIILVGSIFGEIFVSTDGGYNWKFTDYLRIPDYLQQDVEITRIEFSQRNPLVGYAVVTYLFPKNHNNGGLHRTTDGGYNWDIIGFPDTSIWALAVRDRETTDEIFIGGYTEDYWSVKDTTGLMGVGIVRISTDGGATWLNFDDKIDWLVTNRLSNSDLNAISSAFGDTIYAVGDYGIVIRSDDLGKSWGTVHLDNKIRLFGLSFTSGSEGFVCGEGGSLYKTTKGGLSWNKIQLNISNDFRGIAVLPTGEGLIVGDNGTIFRTTDGGQNWVNISLDVNYDFLGVKLLPDGKGVVWGENGTILTSSNFGANWVTHTFDSKETIVSLALRSNDTLIFITNKGKIVKTDWVFTNYKVVYEDPGVELVGIDFPSDSLGFVAQREKYYLRTTDGGNNWVKIKYLMKRNANTVRFVVDSVGFLAGQYTTIARSEDYGLNWSIVNGGPGPRANVWRAYYTGEKGRERLYMATEGGLFVLEYPLSVEEYFEKYAASPLKVHLLPNNQTLFISYELKVNNRKSPSLKLNIFNMIGQSIFSTNINAFGEKFEDFVYLPFKLEKGAYIVQIIEDNVATNRILISY